MNIQGATALLLLAAIGSASAQFEGLITGNGPLTAAQQHLIVKGHNEHRRMAGASDMMQMEYNDVLAEYAQKAANKCRFNHTFDTPQERPQALGGWDNWIGESIYVDNGQNFEVTEAELNWWKEISDYTYEDMTCVPGKMCGHYTQVVWAETSKVGCAVAKCDSIESWGNKEGFIMFCQYARGGNIDGEHPFTPGYPCSACPTSASFCDNGLCSATDPSTVLATIHPPRTIHVYTADEVCEKKLGREKGKAFFCVNDAKYSDDPTSYPTGNPGGAAMCQPKSLKCSENYKKDVCCSQDPVDGLICDVGKICQGTECVDYPTDLTNDRTDTCVYGDQGNFILNNQPQSCSDYFKPNEDTGAVDNLQKCANDIISGLCCETCKNLKQDDEECPWGNSDRNCDSYWEDDDLRAYMCNDPVWAAECCNYKCTRVTPDDGDEDWPYKWNEVWNVENTK